MQVTVSYLSGSSADPNIESKDCTIAGIVTLLETIRIEGPVGIITISSTTDKALAN